MMKWIIWSNQNEHNGLRQKGKQILSDYQEYYILNSVEWKDSNVWIRAKTNPYHGFHVNCKLDQTTRGGSTDPVLQ